MTQMGLCRLRNLLEINAPVNYAPAIKPCLYIMKNLSMSVVDASKFANTVIVVYESGRQLNSCARVARSGPSARALERGQGARARRGPCGARCRVRRALPSATSPCAVRAGVGTLIGVIASAS